MLHIVARALFGARFAHVAAERADVDRKVAAARHVFNGQHADSGTVEIEPDAFAHIGDVLFIETRRRAVIARDGARGTRVDT
jgi:hypothetical protein